MNYDENNYWGYENQYDNYFATPNNYSNYNYSPPPPQPCHYNYSPPPPQPYGYDYIPPQPYGYNYIPPPPPPQYFPSYEESDWALLQSIRSDLITLQHSLTQYSSHVYDEWSDITPLNVESLMTKPSLKVEPDFNHCSICDVTGHRVQDCPNITLVFDISNNLVTTISAKIINGKDYPHVEDAINDVNNLQDASINLANSPIETHVDHIDDARRREKEDTLSECDLDYEKSIMEIKNLLDIPHDMDLDLWKVNSESCSSSTSTSELLLIEPPPHVDPFVG